jgi:dolichyl-phosphate beta-glucosyltransferase
VSAEVDLSVVIPAYNEEKRLPATLGAIERYLGERAGSYEIIVVDDGSHDRTVDIVREAHKRNPCIRAVALPDNRGKGRAVATGVAATRGRFLLITDADLSTPIEELEKLMWALEAGADIVIASRGSRESEEIEQPLQRMLMGKTFNLLVQVLLLPGLWDTQCGFKLFRGDQARQLFTELRTDGFAFDVEILYRGRRHGLIVLEVPVRWVHSAPSRVAPVKHSLQMLKDLVNIRLAGAGRTQRALTPPAGALEPGHRRGVEDLARREYPVR